MKNLDLNSAKNYILYCLSIRMYTKKELSDKLKNKNYPEEIILEAIGSMEDKGIINDYDYAFAYLHDKGLKEFEIDFCCLYAIGMKGKEVKAYTNLSRHYKDCSEVRQKLGLAESDTNLSIFLQKLLKKG